MKEMTNLILGEEGSCAQLDVLRNEDQHSVIRVEVFRGNSAQDRADEHRAHQSKEDANRITSHRIFDTSMSKSLSDGELHEARRLFERFQKENQSSRITFDQFKQIYAYRQTERDKKPDTTNIPVNQGALFKSEEQLENMLTMEHKLAERRRNNLKTVSKEKLCRSLSKLYVQTNSSQQTELKAKFRHMLENDDDNHRINDFANFVLELFNDLSDRDSPANIELEIEFRAIFADLLSVPLDIFDSERSVPRRLLPHLMKWKRAQNIEIAKKIGLDEIVEDDTDELSYQEEPVSSHPMLERLRNELSTSKAQKFFESISACS
mmetsp:Transcript_40147/g.126315  ORF Transcript_40147/g.126315 Transcript_40147/m.126315 type:complete len:321 (+) Transcript_40147:292-1254(+)